MVGWQLVRWRIYGGGWCSLAPDATQDSSICISLRAAPLRPVRRYYRRAVSPDRAPGAPCWVELRSNQEQTAKRLRREAGAFPPSPPAPPSLIRGMQHVAWHPGNEECHSVTMTGTSLAEGGKKYIIWRDVHQIPFFTFVPLQDITPDLFLPWPYWPPSLWVVTDNVL